MFKTSSVELLPIEKLELDKKNPRIRKWIEQYGDEPDFEAMLLALGASSSESEPSGSTVTFSSLKESIRAQGGVINPIFVQKSGDEKYVVIEGNTRVAIYRQFQQDGLTGKWTHIPAFVHDDLSDEDAHAIRLQCHIVGPRPWDPYSKAKYLHQLLTVENMPLSQVVELCGGRRKEIQEYVEAYKEMEKYYRPSLESDADFDASRFSAFIELQKPKVKEAIVEGGYSYKNFAEWVRDGKIDPLNTVRALPRILKHGPAKAKFLAVGAREALKLLDVPALPVLEKVPLDQLLRTLIERLNVIAFQDVVDMREDQGGQKAQLLFEANDVLGELCREVGGEQVQ